MGNRCKLQVYFREDRLNQKEKDYYIEYKDCVNLRENEKVLLNLANEIKEVWNSNFGYFPDDIPSCDYLNVNGVNYFAPDTGFTKGLYLCWDKHNIIPDSFLILFSADEYKNKHEFRGKIYNNDRFYTTVAKALERLDKHEINGDILKLKEAFKELPVESIIELDFSEILQSETYPNYYSLEYYLERVNKLSMIQ